ncbi:(E3-independent) E2 ubiquitin-conjugating enzyme UBE2O isoform X2 [Aethina tumida]|uniref:(E3-independent) E2 ubiquitin-conjugating enzyme UBE2O isoform X2 n=1 Tax=Aethina tumida TaxID=116153 RepID=UPI002148CAB8|nr:(E3-independent) E2 ubiquitin-conjugating enzyme UBE2O isoform X2 [Aethina tumida]
MSGAGEKTAVKEFYANDIVYKLNKRKRVTFGVVQDSYEGSSDVDDFNALQKGQIRVVWSTSCREQVWNQNKVRLMNRSIIPGDIVRRLVKGKETQRGYCKETKQLATLQIVGTDKIIEHVASDRLQGLRPFQVEDAVCLDDKFGRIENVEQLITMQSKCGSIVEVLTSINHELEDYWLAKRNRVGFDMYYPGQEVICVPANLDQPHWLRRSRCIKRGAQSRQRFTIQAVEDVVVEVAWCGDTTHFAEVVADDVKRLKVLERPSDTCLELNERKLLKLGVSDVLLTKKQWSRKMAQMCRAETGNGGGVKVRHVVGGCNNKTRIPKMRAPVSPYSPPPSETQSEEFAADEDWWTEEGELSDEEDCISTSSPISGTTKHNRRHYPPKPRELVPGNTLAVEVVYVESKVTVVWQDGTVEKDVPSTQLYYSISLDDHEFFPGEWVVHDHKKLEEDKPEMYGVIQSVDYLERTTTVKWFEYSKEMNQPMDVSITEMSVYDLKKHPKFAFRPGSIVKAKPTQPDKMGKVIDSCVEGYVKVMWLDHTLEDCWPQNIELIPDSDELDFSDSSDDEDGTSSFGRVHIDSWETESVESYAGDAGEETALQNMAARLDFVRSRILFLREAFRQHTIADNFSFLKDLLLIYDNSSYLDKLLGTSFFSLKSKHFQTLLMQAKEKARNLGVELRGRLFNTETGQVPSLPRSTAKIAEKENINKLIKLEHRMNAEIEKKDDSTNKDKDNNTSTVTTPSAESNFEITQENLCIELLSMLKIRMDLAYAEIISRIGGVQALSVMTKASTNITTPPMSSTPWPTSMPSTPEDTQLPNPLKMTLPPTPPGSAKEQSSMADAHAEGYRMLDDPSPLHHYCASKFEAQDLKSLMKAINKELKLLQESLPPGVWVRSYSSRLDLLSVMIRGPAKTPYEDGLFLFDIQLSQNYPRSPPLVHYISYSSERLNPNLYVEGKVCVSLLGTWMGRGTEVWGPNSTLLQLIVSIQGLILVAEPYYNEAGYEKQTDTQQGYENSRTYNELVVLKLVQSMTEMLQSPLDIFKEEILMHFSEHGKLLCNRLERFCSDTDPSKPDYPLLPVSKGLKLSLNAAISNFKDVLKKVLAQAEK